MVARLKTARLKIIAARDSNNTDEASARREEHHDNTGKTSHDGALVSACEDFHDISGQTGHDGALVSVHKQHDNSGETQNNQPKTLASPSSLAASLSMLPTPKRESYFSILLSHDKCAQSIMKVVKPTQRHISAVNPFHFHKPVSHNGHGGRHWSISQDMSTFNLNRAAKLASYRERDCIIKVYQKTGNPSQRQYVLDLFLSHKSIIANTKLVLQNQLMDNESRAGLCMLKSMQAILHKIFECRKGRITNGERAFVNMVFACIHYDNDNKQLSASATGKQIGLTKYAIYQAKKKSTKRIGLIMSGDKKGFEFVDADQTRSKFKEEQLAKFELWIEKDCQLVIKNPLKNDMVWMRGRNSQVIFDTNNKPIKIQKKLLMGSYRELRLYMIDNYSGMVINEDTVLYSESTLMRITPKHIKKAGECYKQMCGCQTCITFKDMYSCLQIWRKRFNVRQQVIINVMLRSREKTAMQDELNTYKAKMISDNVIIPVRAWDAAAELSCPKICIRLNEDEDAGKYFHKSWLCNGWMQ